MVDYKKRRCGLYVFGRGDCGVELQSRIAEWRVFLQDATPRFSVGLANQSEYVTIPI